MVSSRNAASLRGRRRRGPDPSGTTGGAGGGGGPGRWRPSSRPGPEPDPEPERDPAPVPTLSGLSTPTGALGVREVRGSCEFSMLVPPRLAARVIPSTSWLLTSRLTSRPSVASPSTPELRRGLGLLYPLSRSWGTEGWSELLRPERCAACA